jgi:F-type H+-transporting ATPase subunit delta
MPRNSEAARRYARALYQLSEAGEHGAKPQQVVEELRVFENSYSKNSELQKFFESPVISTEDKKEAISAIEAKLPAIARFLSVLIDAGRLPMIREVVREFEVLLEKASGEVSVTLETARKFSDRGVEEIKRLLESEWNKKVRIEQAVKPEILGGFVAKSAGKSLNASALGQLERLGERLASA